jgi:hypothetical protein
MLKCQRQKNSHQSVLEEVKKEDCADFVFVIYEHTGSTGYGKGFNINNPKHQQAFKDSDACALETRESIKARETFQTEDWLIIIASDHGGIKTNHGGASIQERMTFIVMNKE